MSGLPKLVQRAPYIFYGLAVVIFAGSWLLTIVEVNTSMGYAEPNNPVASLAKWRGLYQAALEAIYIAGTGVMLHILLAIWQSRVTESRTEMPRD